LLLSQDDESYQEILDLVAEVVPEGRPAYLPLLTVSNPLLPGFAYELAWSFDRSKFIRSPTGYVGLRNLSNTCYLNSLFTQLFMNLPFRGFMLDAAIADAEGSQKLLFETKRLFAFMQNSWTKWIEPRDVAGAIRTYENEHIDVTVQMDVDEFYNLLFDRWEGQILSPEAKKRFRSFYGGQLVQQVKSKECPHISEREEPFSAIQCDIKGKSTLEESLKAYVEGEIMEGGEFRNSDPTKPC
jgi:ubiquitin carboxyl-terminal hydrolase 34